MAYQKNYYVSKEEKDVLQHLADGLTAKQIGKILFLSYRTIQAKVGRMIVELDAKNCKNLISIAYQKGYLKINATTTLPNSGD